MIIIISVIVGLFYGIYYLLKPKIAEVDEESPKKVQNFAPNKIPKRIDAIVVGSGISSLCCAANLSNLGYRVVVLEKSPNIGGCLHSYTYQKYEFDSGLHFIGNMFPGKKDFTFLQDVMDEKCEFTSMNRGGESGEAFDKVLIENKTYEIPGEVDKCKQALYNYFPEEKPAIDQYFDEIKKGKSQYNTLFFLKMFPNWLSSFLMKYFYPNLEDEMKKTLEEVVLKITDNKTLRKIMCRYYLIMGGGPSEISFAAYSMLTDHYLKGSSYPTKGSGDMADRIMNYILNRNGLFFVRADVKEIIINNSNKKVEGVRIKYLDQLVDVKSSIVISTIGIPNTYKLLENIPNVKESKGYKLVQTMSNSEAAVTVELVLDGSPEDFGIDSSNYWFFPDGTFHDNLEKFYKDSNTPIPVVYCTCLTAKSQYYREKYAGKTLLQLITFGGDYKWYEKWRNERPMCRSEEYAEVKDKIANQMLEYVYNKFKNAREKEVFHRSSSPLTNEFYINTPQGSCYGIKPTPEKFLNWKYFRIFTEYSGLYNSGQDVFSHGVLGAFWSGYFCAACVAPQLFIKLILLSIKASRMKK